MSDIIARPKIKRRYTRKWKARKESWLGKQEGGIRVRDESKAGMSIEGLYIFKMKYDWGKRDDGTPMVGERLAIAPYYEMNGEIFWRARQCGAPGGKLKFQHDLISIDPKMGYRVADAILRMLGEAGLSEKEAEEDMETTERKRREEKINRLIGEVL